MADKGIAITYLGQCCFLIEGAGRRIVTDPYLSNALDIKYKNSDIKWERSYAPPCMLSDAKPDTIIISHEHDDHFDQVTLMEYLKTGGNASIILPEPFSAKAKDMGFKKVVAARAESTIKFGNVTVTPIACAHTKLDTDENGHFLYLSYIIDFGEECVFFGGDMSLYDGLRERIQLENCTLMILPCNGRDEYRTSHNIIGNTTAEEAAELAASVFTPFIPAHHDLYAVNGRPADEIVKAAADAGAEVFVLAPGEKKSFESDDDDDFDDDDI